MNLTDTITFYSTTADSFGDDIPSSTYVTATAVEQASSFARGLNAELQTGELRAWIAPDSNVWLTLGLTMSGMVAHYRDTVYRVSSAVPGGSLLTDEEDLIELTLTKDVDGQ